MEMLQIVGAGGFGRKGIVIALVVIGVILGLIAMAIVLVTPREL